MASFLPDKAIQVIWEMTAEVRKVTESGVFAKEEVGGCREGMKSVNTGNLQPLEVGFSVSDQPYTLEMVAERSGLMTSSAT